tara:strand:- start:1044 stop:1505 length:462 start_codon:yes stop_codon:yes gene_type:complete
MRSREYRAILNRLDALEAAAGITSKDENEADRTDALIVLVDGLQALSDALTMRVEALENPPTIFKDDAEDEPEESPSELDVDDVIANLPDPDDVPDPGEPMNFEIRKVANGWFNVFEGDTPKSENNLRHGAALKLHAELSAPPAPSLEGQEAA